jgi:hypothetical protein
MKRRVLRIIFLGLALVVSGAACEDGGGVSKNPLGQDGSVDSSASEADDASDGAASADALVFDGDAADYDGPTGPVVYVSATTGNDATNDGLSPSRPKKTIVAGLSAAKAAHSIEVHVCRGTYNEYGLNLNAALSLKGAYDCTTWTRTAAYGYPSFDRVNETVIESGNSSMPAALLVSGTVPSSVVVDGFTIRGGSAGTGDPTIGIAVQDGASPVLSNNDIHGGAGTQSADAGTDAGTVAYGSVGVLLTGTGTPNVHDDAISGGSSPSSSIGILSEVSLTKAGNNPLANVTVSGADLTLMVSAKSDGIVLQGGASADILQSDVYANGTPSPMCQISHGVYDLATGDVTLVGDRIFGGYCVGSYGVYLGSSGKLEADNCMIHGGEGAATGVYQVEGTLTLTFDTIYESGKYNSGIWAQSGSTTIRNVLLLGGLHNFGISACSVADVDHSVLTNFLYAATCPMVGDYTDLSKLGGTQSANTIVDPGPDASSACDDCPEVLVSGWGMDDGVSALFAITQNDAGSPSKGWSLVAPPPCAIATGGTPVTGLPADINGTPRSASTPSVGATEVVGSCK